MRIPISRAGATYETGLIASAVRARMYEKRESSPTPTTAPRRAFQVERSSPPRRSATGAITSACPTIVAQS